IRPDSAAHRIWPHEWTELYHWWDCLSGLTHRSIVWRLSLRRLRQRRSLGPASFGDQRDPKLDHPYQLERKIHHFWRGPVQWRRAVRRGQKRYQLDDRADHLP